MFPFNFFHSNEYPARMNFSDHILISERLCDHILILERHRTLSSASLYKKQLKTINIKILVLNVPLVEYILRLMSGD